MKMTLGFSPCPNDTFIFDALVNKKIDTEGIEFEAILEDVETLNEWALQDKLDVTKLSFPAFFRSTDNYILLSAGSALGKGVGPLLISNKPVDNSTIQSSRVAIPGLNTTANLLLAFAYPEVSNRQPMLFSAIEEAVLNGDADLGVIIHENRFTYQDKGLHKVSDLGEVWESKTSVPIPLGGIAINQSIRYSTAIKVQALIRKSLQYAFDHYPEITGYVKSHSQTMSEEVMRKHIDLYVNEYSLDLGNNGKLAIGELYKVFLSQTGLKGADINDLFL